MAWVWYILFNQSPNDVYLFHFPFFGTRKWCNKHACSYKHWPFNFYGTSPQEWNYWIKGHLFLMLVGLARLLPKKNCNNFHLHWEWMRAVPSSHYLLPGIACFFLSFFENLVVMKWNFIVLVTYLHFTAWVWLRWFLSPLSSISVSQTVHHEINVMVTLLFFITWNKIYNKGITHSKGKQYSVKFVSLFRNAYFWVTV